MPLNVASVEKLVGADRVLSLRAPHRKRDPVRTAIARPNDEPRTAPHSQPGLADVMIW
jgi:hypothetical protein